MEIVTSIRRERRVELTIWTGKESREREKERVRSVGKRGDFNEDDFHHELI